MRNDLKSKFAEPVVLLILAILAYGLQINTLGVFGDDWPHLWVFNMFGLSGLDQLVAWDRPYSAWVYFIIAPIAGENIWAYHLYLLLLRWFCATLFYYLIKEIIPDSAPFTLWASALFLLYPGFRQQPQPLEFILHFTGLAFLLLSFLLMLKASKTENKNQKLLFHTLGTGLNLSLFSVEYFIGLELLRPVLLLIVNWKNTNNKLNSIKRSLYNWVPYFIVLMFYAFWRIFIFKFPTYKPTFLSKFSTDPIAAIVGLGQVLIQEIRTAILGAWRQMISLPQETLADFSYYSLILFTTVIVLFILLRMKKVSKNTTPRIPLLLGILSILLAGIPFWITGIPIQLDFPWDRSTLPFMFGASLLTASGLLLIRPALRNPVAAVIISLCIGMHYQNSIIYQSEWNKLREFFWQLSWRAPNLKSGTIVLSEEIPLFYYGDNNLTPILNWTYAPDLRSTDIPYNFFDMGERLGNNLPELAPDFPVEHGYRFVNFKSNSNQLLPVFFEESSCLHIVDGKLAEDKKIPDHLRKAAEFSNPESLILVDHQAFPPNFIKEPAHGWCYYYQKAGLAVQKEDWSEVKDNFLQVEHNKLSPVDTSEWLPFIEGFLRTDSINEAVELTQRSLENDNARPVICDLWKNFSSNDPEIRDTPNKGGCE